MNRPGRVLPCATWIRVALGAVQFVLVIPPAVAQESAPAPITYVAELERRLPLADDLFGASLANLGDLDGDGEEEVAIGAPHARVGGVRRGSISIVAIPSGRLVRTLHGWGERDSVGWNLTAVRLDPRRDSVLLAVDGAKPLLLNPAAIVDPRTGARILELPGVTHVHGTQSDLDGDGLRELVVTAVRNPTAVEILSSATGRAIEPLRFPANVRLLDLDVDGDGFLDFLRRPWSFDREIEFLSGKSREVLGRLSFESAPAPRPWSFATTGADVDGDGQQELVLQWSDVAERASRLIALRGGTLEACRELRFHEHVLPRFGAADLRSSIRNLGDVDGDRCDDVLVPCTADGTEGLVCHSGSDGSILWQASEVASAERIALELAKDVDGDGVREVLCGSTEHHGYRGVVGPPGTVFLLSGRTGRALNVLVSPMDPERAAAHAMQRTPPSTKLESQRWDPDCTLFGLSVAALGDHDGDGEEEIAIGAPGAWTAYGRTGAVLILGMRSHRLLRTIAGDRHDGEFGFFLEAVPDAPGSRTNLLCVRVPESKLLFDPKDGRLVREEPHARTEDSLGIDVDGDGRTDLYRDPGPEDSELVVVSGTRMRELVRLPLEGPRGEHGRFSTVAGDFDGDGSAGFAMSWPGTFSETQCILVFSGSRLQKRIRIDLAKRDTYRLKLYNCGDFDRDGLDDVLVALPVLRERTLICYSGATGRRIWAANSAVDDETSVVRLQDLDGDGIGEVLSGFVHYSTTGGYDKGSVFVLSGKTGRRLDTFVEAEYPTISHASYLASFAK